MTRRRDLPVYLTDAQIGLVLTAIDRLEIEMCEPGELQEFTSSQLRALQRAKSTLLQALAPRP